jgi:hypothetical protein
LALTAFDPGACSRVCRRRLTMPYVDVSLLASRAHANSPPGNVLLRVPALPAIIRSSLAPPRSILLAARRTGFIVVLRMARGSIRPCYHCKRYKRSNSRRRNKRGNGRGMGSMPPPFREFEQKCLSACSVPPSLAPRCDSARCARVAEEGEGRLAAMGRFKARRSS